MMLTDIYLVVIGLIFYLFTLQKISYFYSGKSS